MHLKDKLRKAFNSSATSSPTRDSHSPEELVYRPAEPRWPSNVYRWDEPLPRLKYRGPVKIEHKKKLESFQLGSQLLPASRRRSHMSDHSPMSSRHQSRRSSITSQKNRNSIQGRRASHSLRVRTSITAATIASAQLTPPSVASPRELRRNMREGLCINASIANSLASSSTAPLSASSITTISLSPTASSPSSTERDPYSPTYPLSPTKTDFSQYRGLGRTLHLGPSTHLHDATTTTANATAFDKEQVGDGIPITPPKSPHRMRDLLVVNTSTANEKSRIQKQQQQQQQHGDGHKFNSSSPRSQNPFAPAQLLTPVTPERFGDL